MRWIVMSLVLSLVLTVVLNVAVRVFPGAWRRLTESIENTASAPADDWRVRVYVPWKAMIVASVVLTVVLNVVLWLS